MKTYRSLLTYKINKPIDNRKTEPISFSTQLPKVSTDLPMPKCKPPKRITKMEITKIEEYSIKKLIEKLRKVTMLKNPSVKIYKDAFISLEKINTDFLTPPQRYILRDNIKNKLELKFTLEKRIQLNLFNIDGYIEFINNDLYSIYYGKTFTLLPPIIEESIEENGKVFNIINDGMHRIYLARLLGIIPKVVFIRGIPKEYPYYAYPLRNGWDDVIEIDSIQPNYIKKLHRIEDNKRLYRNFDSVFINCSTPRK